MKNFRGIFAVIFSLLNALGSFAQNAEETKIRILENEERRAILNSDTAMLYKLMSVNIVVQNPENTIVGFRQIIERVKSGKINYALFERYIDKITFIGKSAIVMGKEIIIQEGENDKSKRATRRFTNVWLKEKRAWKLSARQATIVLPN